MQILDLATGIETYEPDPVPTVPERQAMMRRQINDKRDGLFAAGFPVSGTGTALDGQTLQTRDESDKINWLTSQAAYSAAIAGGAGSVEGANFRTVSNATVTLTYTQGLNVLLAMAAWGKDIMGNSWVLKDAVADAEDGDALDLIDVEAGWP